MRRKLATIAQSAFRAVFNERVLARIATALAFLGSVNLATVPVGFDTIDFVKKINYIDYLLYLLCIVLLLSVVSKLVKFNSDAYALAVAAGFYCCYMAFRHRNLYFSIGLLLVVSVIGYYLMRDDKLNLARMKFGLRPALYTAGAAAVFFAVYVGGLTTLRYLNYSTSTYDFGIFSQMFYYMKETFLPYTTCERSELLSHFAVHLSPIYYLLLPGYLIFPSPVYLQIMQALIVASAVIPLFLLARRNRLSYKATAALCAAFCFHPALAGSCFYDIHENLFLAPLLLWLFYFIECRQWKLMYLFGLLACFVKEDAAFYVACAALFLFFSKKEKKHGAALFSVSVIYFFLAIMFINSFGEGAMISRYGNFISDSEWGLLSVFRTIISNPAYILTEVFVQEKAAYMLIMLVPVAFLPLLNRDLSQMILLLPFLVINLMSNYPYQHSILFQYNFGTLAFFYYLVILNIPKFGAKHKKYGLTLMVAASVIMFISQVGGYTNNIQNYINNREKFAEITRALNAIPQDASVRASGYFVPRLAARRELYDIQYSNDVEKAENADYIAIDMRPGAEQYSEQIVQEYMSRGYETADCRVDLYCILKKPEL